MHADDSSGYRTAGAHLFLEGSKVQLEMTSEEGVGDNYIELLASETVAERLYPLKKGCGWLYHLSIT